MLLASRNWLRQVSGSALCLVVAVIIVSGLRSTALKSFLPLAFLSVVIFVAFRCGSVAGISGTIGAALIFAEFLFDPIGSIRINDLEQRDHLIWMVVIGIAASELIGTHPKAARGGSSAQAELPQPSSEPSGSNRKGKV